MQASPFRPPVPGRIWPPREEPWSWPTCSRLTPPNPASPRGRLPVPSSHRGFAAALITAAAAAATVPASPWLVLAGAAAAGAALLVAAT